MKNPLNKPNQVHKSQGPRETSTLSCIPSQHDSYVVLGDFIQDIAYKLARKEKELSGFKGNGKI